MYNNQAFLPEKYNSSIVNTLPYYEEYFKQIIDIVDVVFNTPVTWLDMGCGTGKMAGIAVENLQIKKMICHDISKKMLEIAKGQICSPNVDFREISIQNIKYWENFHVVTTILLNHYLTYEDRIISIKNCYNALKKNGLFFSIENFAPDSDRVTDLYLKRWKKYQQDNGRSEQECEKHIQRYNTEYFPLTIEETIHILKKCGFENVEIFWCSYMQVGILGIKS